MNTEDKMIEETPQDYLEDDLLPATDTPYVPDPIRNPTELDAEIIKSHYKQEKLLLKKPVFKELEVAVVFKNRNGKPKLVNGMPVVKKIIKVNVFDHYENEEVEFPIKNLYTDSLTSSILDKDEANVVRDHHDLIWVIGMRMLTDPDFDSVRFIHRLNGATATLLESAKSIGGGGLEWSKSSISKQESKSYDFRQNKEFDDYQNRLNKRKGLFGLGFGPNFLNK
ncbi:hypothetical protein GOV13_02740 [Candidatus Pacearchaeota archaeon]|nr:hypothetical protein [Candidatus Pacearchaeota archaeon]